MGNGLFISYLHSPTSFLPWALLFIGQTIGKAMGGGREEHKHTHKKLMQGKNNERNTGHVNKHIHTAEKIPHPTITLLINGPLQTVKSNHISWFTCDDIVVKILVINNKSISL